MLHIVKATCVVLLMLVTIAYGLRILPEVESVTQAMGRSTMLTCDAGDETAKIQWKDHLGREITATTGRVYIESDPGASKLYVTNIESSDSGKYTCTSTLRGKQEHKSIHLFLFKDITFDHHPDPQNPAIFTNTTIECMVSGKPQPIISWRYNRRPITMVPGGRYKETARGLNITNITQADDGNYTCRAEVPEAGRYDERTITVKVHIPPKLTTKMMTVEGTQGQNISLSCAATGLPSPKYEFHKNVDGKAIISSDRVFVDSDYGKLHFRPLVKEDNGTYICKAMNDVGNASLVGSVTVNVLAKIYEISNVTKSESETATLVCLSEGLPYPNMTFQKVGRPNTEYKMGPNEGGRVTVSSRSGGRLELSIQNVQPSDTGHYVCHSRNKVGKNDATGSLTVAYRPRFVPEQKSLFYSWVGRTSNITCSATAHPPAKFRWLRGNKEIVSSGNKYQIFNEGNTSHLQLRVQLNDNDWKGEYLCEASNSQGTNRYMMRVDEAGVPGKPSKVDLKEASPNMLLLSVWPPTASTGIDVIGYRVEYENKVQDFATGFPDGYYLDVPHNYKKEAKPKGEEIRIENLQPNKTYLFRIRAKNDVGIGREVITINGTTLQIREPYPIEIISPRHGGNSHYYDVIWATPKTGGRPIKFYQVAQCKGKLEPNGQVVPAEPWKLTTLNDDGYKSGPITKHTIYNLDPETWYLVKIVAENELTKKTSGVADYKQAFAFQTSKVNPLASSSRAGIAIIAGKSCVLYSLRLLSAAVLTIVFSSVSTNHS